MMFTNRISSSTSCSIWLHETSPTSSARGTLAHRFQSCNTSLGVIQDAIPKMFHVVTPHPDAPVQTFRVHDFSAYFRFIRARLQVTTPQEPDADRGRELSRACGALRRVPLVDI
jgi:hypothetical protein